MREALIKGHVTHRDRIIVRAHEKYPKAVVPRHFPKSCGVVMGP
jgi:hypothetical protein